MRRCMQAEGQAGKFKQEVLNYKRKTNQIVTLELNELDVFLVFVMCILAYV